jgi:dihydropteroate synthase
LIGVHVKSNVSIFAGVKNTRLAAMYTLNCKGKLLSLQTPVVMGIINATPDSFAGGHLTMGIDAMVALAGQMLADGAAILDIGGQSTRPGSQPLTAAEEAARVLPVIAAISRQYPQAIISIDTYFSQVALAAVQAGAHMVNDISAGDMDSQMMACIAPLNTPYICMHMQGTPLTMQQQPAYKDITLEVLDYFIQKIADCKRAGIHDVIIDPGFGFGKTIQHNFRLLQQLSVFSAVNCPLLVGLSRKSTIYKTLGITAHEALNGTTVLNTLALQQGANLLRVHDVKEAVQAVQLFTALQQASMSA